MFHHIWYPKSHKHYYGFAFPSAVTWRRYWVVVVYLETNKFHLDVGCKKLKDNKNLLSYAIPEGLEWTTAKA